MYIGKGTGRWAESSSSTPGLPYKPTTCACTAARRDEAEGTRSLPRWPYHAAAATAVWIGMGEVLRASPPLGKRSPPRLCRPLHLGWRGVHGACPPLIWWLSAEAAADSARGENVATATRGYSGPPKCG